MEKLEKVIGVPSLFRNPRTGMYYVRKYVTGRGELLKSTRQTNLYQAKLVMNRLLAQWLGSRDEKGNAFFEDIAIELLALKKQMTASPTYKNFKCTLENHVLPFYAGTTLNDVGPKWLKYKARQKELKPNRKLQHDRRYILEIMRYAARLELLDKVPELEIDASDRTPAEGREYSNKELKSLLAEADPALSLKIELQVKCGMRRNEVRLLKWEYINFANGYITLPPEVCKTRYGRTYPIPRDTLDRIKFFPLKGEFVFANKLDWKRPESKTDKGWQRLKKALGIKGKQHWLRHTAVTRFIRGGINPTVAQKAVGMSDQVMKRVYFHVNRQDLDDLSTVVDRSMEE